ncbi:MAG: WbqC family protein [Bacteroidetes bacterium]|nr:WbqC family protein [Bacteroidota bacterium]
MPKNLPPYLFPSVSWFLSGIKNGEIRTALGGNFEKQTSRSRYAIAGPNSVQTLSVPVVHGGSRLLSETQISAQNPWVKKHIRAITTAYGNAPFFEFYDYRVLPLLNAETISLKSLIVNSIEFLHRQLQCPVPLVFVDEWNFMEPEIIAPAYPQVFEDRHGFRKDVSALDLLFNLGPEATEYWDDFLKSV